MTEPATVDDVIRNRRSNLRIDPDRPIADDVIIELCELATWAPNHKHTHPWHFTVFTGEGRAKLGEALAAGTAEALPSDAENRDAAIEKSLTKYLRAPAVVIVSASGHENSVLHNENRDSAAAGIQNLLLAATARGLASFWTTGAAATDERVGALCDLAPDEQIVGIIYLGWPTAELPPMPRPDPDIRWVS